MNSCHRLLKSACILVSFCLVFPGCGGKQDSKEANNTAAAKNDSSEKANQNEDSPNSKKQANNIPEDKTQSKSSDRPGDVTSGKTLTNKKEVADNSDSKSDELNPGNSKQDTSANPGDSDAADGDSTSPKTDDANNNEGEAKQTNAQDDSKTALEKLNQQIADFQVPPPWIKDVTTKWDVANKPWKEARLEIRRLLGVNTEAARREGIKLTWDYLQKNDMGDKHEYGMYMFLGGEPIWAIIAFRERLATKDLKYPPFFGVVALASLYSDYGVYEEAEKALKRGVKMRPPKREWYEMREAEMHDSMGDLYAVWGKIDKAKASYREAIRLYPLGKPPYGRHLLPRRAKKVQTKLDLLSAASLANTNLKDGTYQETALGYSGDIKLTVKVTGGKIANVGVQHQEKIDQNACKIIPQRIVDKQSLTVDGISGATVTKDAIVAGTLRALRKAGLD